MAHQPPGAAADTSALLDDFYSRLKEHDPQWLLDTLRGRWEHVKKVASGQNERELAARPAAHRTPHEPPQVPIWAFDITVADWHGSSSLTDHMRHFRSQDWALTSLGPMERWPKELRTLVNLTFCCPMPSALWWGEDKTIIYNEGYAPVLGRRHPCQGKPFDQVWPELIPFFEPTFNKGETSGLASSGENALFMTDRNGFKEELVASWNIIPFPGPNGVVGFFNPVVETTAQALTSRRLSTLLRLGESTAAATTFDQLWTAARSVLQDSQHDVPFAAFYSSSADFTPGSNTLRRAASQDPGSPGDNPPRISKRWHLRDAVGLPDCLPSVIDSGAPPLDFIPSIAAVLSGGHPVVLQQDAFPPRLANGVARSEPFDTNVDACVILPIGPTQSGMVLGFAVLGINPCGFYDHEYEQFMHMISRQMSTSLAALVLMEEERKRAAEDRMRLSAQLAATEQKALDTETRFRQMADLSPVGLFSFDARGNLIYANETWFTLTEHSREAFYPMSWRGSIHPDDLPAVDKEWEKLAQGGRVEFEMRVRKPFHSQDHLDGILVEGDTWLIAAAYADKDEYGKTKYVSGSMTDVSKLKWMEGLQARRVKEAIELRRQQENFVDITCHEARNPLSAITLCAESIAGTLRDAGTNSPDLSVTLSSRTISKLAEEAAVIQNSANHQKRILDDVLTLSKLDSKLLVITPVPTKPEETLNSALRMLSSELEKGDIQATTVVTPSYRTLGVEWVELDNSRLLQVLINLIANAVKFTRTQRERRITLTLDASQTRPASSPDGVPFVRRRSHDTHHLTEPTADDLYLIIAVKDSGTGIPEDELKQLFQRFKQTSAGRNADFSGSGLGLWICLELIQLQQGDIGVRSEVGKGSTFAFFVRTVRCAAPLAVSKGFLASPHPAAHYPILKTPRSRNHGDGLSPTAPCKHILLVEDNLVNQKVMSMQLRKSGYEVSVASHGIEALDVVRKSQFCLTAGSPLDLVLMDVEMPIMNGLICVETLRRMERRKEVKAHIPVIAVTANARAEQQASALAAGMDSVVVKPFQMVDLLPEIERVFEASHTATVDRIDEPTD